MRKYVLFSLCLIGLKAFGYPQYAVHHPNIGGLLPTVVRYGATFDPMEGVLAYDHTDGYISNISISGTVNTAVAGDYTLTYSVVNSAGESKQVEREVTVLPPGQFCRIDATGRIGPHQIIALDDSYTNTLATNVTFIEIVVKAGDNADYRYSLVEREWDDPDYTNTPPLATNWCVAGTNEFYHDLYLCRYPRKDRWLKVMMSDTNTGEYTEVVYGIKGDPGVPFVSPLDTNTYYRLSEEVDDPETSEEQFNKYYAQGGSFWLHADIPTLKRMGVKAKYLTYGNPKDSYGDIQRQELQGLAVTVRAFMFGANKRDGSDENWAKVERHWFHTLGRQMNMSYRRAYELFFSEVKMDGFYDHFTNTYATIRANYNPKRIYIGPSNYGSPKTYTGFYDLTNDYFQIEWHTGHFDKMFRDWPKKKRQFPCYFQYPRINETFRLWTAALDFKNYRSIHVLARDCRMSAAILDKCGFMAPLSSGEWSYYALPYIAMWYCYDGYDYLNNAVYFKDDWDGDGVPNADEVTYGTDPFNADTDEDCIFDSDEIKWGLDPLDPSDASEDLDGDRISNFDESVLTHGTRHVGSGTPPIDPVTMTDSNGVVHTIALNNPDDGMWDEDDDMLPVWFEATSGANPMGLNTFKDGLKGSFTWYLDTAKEYGGCTMMMYYQMDLKLPDDHDGLGAYDEIKSGLDPQNPNDYAADWDGDGLSNSNELAQGTSIVGDDTNGPVFNASMRYPTCKVGENVKGPSLAYSVTAPDVDEKLTFTKLSGPSWLSVDSTGQLSGTPDTADEGVNSWQVQVEDGLGRSDTAELVINVKSAGTAINYAAWVSGQNLGTSTNILADPDGDGLNNLMEYAIGGNPQQADRIVPLSIHRDSTGNVKCTYRRRHNAADLEMYLESTRDLLNSNWTTGTTYEIGSGPIDSLIDNVTNGLVNPQTPPLYFRLRVRQR